ncbi:YbjN domain-containing protein [Bacteroidia bacterium]|nr:YbjN domain-containing protein [Bacteroidia bacterium]MDB4107892.1 YbjN domain-containing protein [Bacteroidia bacterium]MDB9883391.1 YbjN domain-containing protein [Bacteroidia bacterium]
MDVKDAIGLFENVVEKHLQLKPEQTRCENEGEYIVKRGDATELYIDIWQPKESTQWQYFDRNNIAGIFQIVAPVCEYPADEHLGMFMEELAHLNFHLFSAKFIANSEQRIVSIQFKRVLEGINETEIIEPLEAVGYYAENLKEYLAEKYHVKKI